MSEDVDISKIDPFYMMRYPRVYKRQKVGSDGFINDVYFTEYKTGWGEVKTKQISEVMDDGTPLIGTNLGDFTEGTKQTILDKLKELD